MLWSVVCCCLQFAVRCCRSLVRSLVRCRSLLPFVRWFVRWFVGSFVGSSVRWLVCWFVCSFVRLFVGWLVRWLVCWFVCSFVCSLVGWFVGSLVGWFVRSFVCSLVGSFVRWYLSALGCLLLVVCRLLSGGCLVWLCREDSFGESLLQPLAHRDHNEWMDIRNGSKPRTNGWVDLTDETERGGSNERTTNGWNADQWTDE